MTITLCSPLQKAGIFEFNDGNSLEESTGFIASIMKIVTKHLNLSATLMPTQGPGTMDRDGSWNGVVGVLVRGVSSLCNTNCDCTLWITVYLEKLSNINLCIPYRMKSVLYMCHECMLSNTI